MAINYPGPYEIRLNYTVTIASVVRGHQLRHSLNLNGTPSPGEIFADYDAVKKNAGLVALSTYVVGLEALLDDIYSNTCDFGTCELWKYTAGTFDAEFYSEYTLGTSGENVTANKRNTESIITFRSVGGGFAKLYLEETPAAQAISQTFPTTNADINALATYMTDANAVMIARDNTYLFSALKWHPGENEHWVKETYRT